MKTLIVGIDEAGRGALAGPVVAAACSIPVNLKKFPVRIADSKKMTPLEREESFLWLTKHCLFGIGIVSHNVIDEEGILAANERAMQQAVKSLESKLKKKQPLYLLVDGRDKFWFDHPHSSIIRGDDSEKCISAASIIAKVTRDHLIIDLDSKYPGYGFVQHKGYGTVLHTKAIKKLGISKIHRKTFVHVGS